MSPHEILVVDDEMQMRRLLGISLQANGFQTVEASSAKEAISHIVNRRPHLVLLDLKLPGQSGHEMLVDLRSWFSGPVIILSVLNDEENIVMALDSGANDYLVKPFRTGELVARIRAAIRNNTSNPGEPEIRFPYLRVDFPTRMVYFYDEPVRLTSTQFMMVSVFAKNEGKVLTHQYLLKEIWGEAFYDQYQYLRVFVAQLRKKLEQFPKPPASILTEQGIGYRFIAES